MNESKQVNIFIEEVCNEVRWKCCRKAISSELENHIAEQRDFFLIKGMDKEEAESKAIHEMGKASEIGKQLNQAYKPKFNIILLIEIYFIIFSTLILFCNSKGIISETAYLKEKLIYLAIGTLGILLALFIDYSKIYIYTKYIFILNIVFIIFISYSDLIPFSYKREFTVGLSLLFPILYVCCIYRFQGKYIFGFIITQIIFLIPVFISVLISDFTSAFILILSEMLILLYSLRKNWFELRRREIGYIISIFPLIFSVVFILFIRGRRNFSFLQPFYIKEFIRNIYLFGSPFSSSIVNDKLMNEYPLTALTYKYGFIVLLIYLFTIFLIFNQIRKIHKKQNTFFGALLSIVIGFVFFIELLSSLFLNLGMPIIKGFRVPFIDIGISLSINMLLIGFLEILDSFGNFIFMDFSFLKDKKLFEIEEGKLIVYLR